MTHHDVIIIGAGAAGLMCAISATQRDKSVLILEKNQKPGLKILISGGGRCNFTNLHVTPKHYVSQNPKFCVSALKQFSNQDFIEKVKKHKINYFEKTSGQLFCEKSSKEILELLLSEIDKRATLKTSSLIKSIEKKDDHFIVCTHRATYSTPSLVIATGGLSFKKLGASDFGYQIAEKFGHTCTPLRPALDGFLYPKNLKIFSEISGISLEVRIKVAKQDFEENILFTHKGISGPAALKASLYWETNMPVKINFLPQIKDTPTYLWDLKEKHPKKDFLNLLTPLFPERFIELFFGQLKIENQKGADISKKTILKLSEYLTNFTFTPPGTVGYDKAEVTKGGINTHELSSKTMESKIVPGLYFIGEIVDVTGLLGGYNFQWAWSSGYVAGQNV